MTYESEQLEHRERKRSRWGYVVGLLSLLILYFLSLPFAYGVFGIWTVAFEDSALATFYSPVHWLISNVGFVNSFYGWYFSLFPESWFWQKVP